MRISDWSSDVCASDLRLVRDHDFSNKAGVVHSEIMLPEGAPERLNYRATLWNEVEAGEKRKDAQLSREVEFSIPRELNQQQGVQLAREFVEKPFVERGMVADQIGRASCRARVWQYVSISVVAVALKKKQ